MKKAIVPVLLLLMNVCFGQTYLVKQWDHTYGGYENETMTAIKETNDKGFILGGFTRSDTGANVSENTRGGTDFWIVNTDSNGVFRWDKRFGGNLEDRLYSIDIGTRGSVILGGFTTTDSSGDVSQHTKGGMDYWVVKTDSLGTKIWDRRFGGSDYDRFTSLVRCSDGGILVGGFTFSDSSGDISQVTRGGEDFWVIKIDSAGNKIWDKRFGGDDTDDLWYIIETSDGGFLLGGVTNSDSTGDVSQHSRGMNDTWIVRINSTGTKLWDKRFGGAYYDGISSMAETPDGGFIIYNVTTSDSTGDVSQHTRDTSMVPMDRGDLWIVKTDSLGNKLWDKVIGGSLSEGASGSITVTADNNYFFGCNTFSPESGDKSEDNFGRSQSWIMKADTLGNLMWDKTVYSNFEDEGSFQLQCKDGCYLVANNSHSNVGGYKTEMSIGQNDYWMVKFCESEHPQLPVADFDVIDSAGLCAGGCFTFTNSSVNAGDFEWLFPGGVPSSSSDPVPPSVCYSTPGTYDVTLIATNNDGSDTLTVTGSVTVFQLPSVSINQTGDTLSVPAGYPYYQWYYNDSLLLNDTLNYHIATANGDYSILILDSNGCPGQDTIYSFNVGLASVSDQNDNINIWPNPAKSFVDISSARQIREITLTDITGRLVYSDYAFKKSSINISHLSKGIYILRMKIADDIISRKLIIE